MISRIHPDSLEPAGRVVIDNKFYMDSVTPLTVWKKSLVLNCSGYTVYDPHGNLIFRVDNYCSDPKNEVLLMDAAGLVLLTLRRKRLSLHNEWQGFLGELQNAQKPLFVARRSLSLFIPTNNLAEVYVLSPGIRKTKRHSDYHIKRCYAKRSFTFLNSFSDVVAEVKPKQGGPGQALVLGKRRKFGVLRLKERTQPSDSLHPTGRKRNDSSGPQQLE